MRVCTYTSADAPERKKHMGVFFDGDGPTAQPLPIRFFGRTKDLVVTAAENWIAQERAKETAAREAAAQRAEKRRA